MNAPQGLAAPASGTEIPDFEALAADPEIAPLLHFDPVVRKVKRPDGWTPELQRELIARIASTGTLQAAVWQMGKHATGAEALYKVPGAQSFRTSWTRRSSSAGAATASTPRLLTPGLSQAFSAADRRGPPTPNRRRRSR